MISLPGYCEEMSCYQFEYDDDGEVDWESDGKMTCATYEEGCPCNEEWEVSCESWGFKAGRFTTRLVLKRFKTDPNPKP